MMRSRRRSSRRVNDRRVLELHAVSMPFGLVWAVPELLMSVWCQRSDLQLAAVPGGQDDLGHQVGAQAELLRDLIRPPPLLVVEQREFLLGLGPRSARGRPGLGRARLGTARLGWAGRRNRRRREGRASGLD